MNRSTVVKALILVAIVVAIVVAVSMVREKSAPSAAAPSES